VEHQSVRRQRCVARVSIFLTMLIMVASMAGIVGCGGLKSQYTPMVAAGESHTVGLESDGTAVAVGWDYFGQCNVGSWDLG
jgi:alpha-tubulin suppressor-like RCC1 family protein